MSELTNQRAGLEGRQIESRSNRFWSGVRRGAKFGAIVGLIIAVVLNVFSIGLVLAVPTVRNHALADIEKDGVISVIASACGGAGLVVIYSAITGSVAMGIARFLRAEKSQTRTLP